MEQEDKQGMCEAQDSQDKGMGSDSESCEDREGDPDERGMGSNPQDEAPRGHSEERELMPNICTGEEGAGEFLWKLPHSHCFLAPLE